MSKFEVTAQVILSLIDLTSLNDSDTLDSTRELCESACSPIGVPAAICIYPQFISFAKKRLGELGLDSVSISTVVNFPNGGDDIDRVVKETKEAIGLGADEVDVVFPYHALTCGKETPGYELVRRCKQVCGPRLLKVIIEVGELREERLIKRASEIAILSGADFIKTSTGKVAVNTTPEYARMMLEVIRDMAVSDSVGFKASGGVRTLREAQSYIEMAGDMLGFEWVRASHYRFGASSLLSNLLSELGYPKTISSNY